MGGLLFYSPGSLFQTKVHSSGQDLKENYSAYKKCLTLLPFILFYDIKSQSGVNVITLIKS